jgi:hypothetical protein
MTVFKIFKIKISQLARTSNHNIFFKTDAAVTAQKIIELYSGRWNIETTFHEMREHLGLETTRGWTRITVMRNTVFISFINSCRPILRFVAWYPPHVRCRIWANKQKTIFSDMTLSVRQYLWIKLVFAQVPGECAVQKLPPKIRSLLDFSLMQVA